MTDEGWPILAIPADSPDWSLDPKAWHDMGGLAHTAVAEHFTPGHCQDIDGGLWHEPGQCPGAVLNCDGKCCS